MRQPAYDRFMRVIPVLDVQAGQVVHAVGGRRSEYRPLVSKLVDSSAPGAVARVIRETYGAGSLYVADLDAIGGWQPDVETYRALHSYCSELWVDAGIRDGSTAAQLIGAGVDVIVVGLETVQGPDALERLCKEYGKLIAFSLDLKAGKPLGDLHLWLTDEPLAIAAKAIQLGITRIIVLDLADVGKGQGVGTEDLCQLLIKNHPKTEIIAGGGIRDTEDLQRLESIGVHGALVCSALHDGRLGRGSLQHPSQKLPRV
jgi:phosphoribosylformimino-5-aminoimidazole carboxamide ribotide isomerase